MNEKTVKRAKDGIQQRHKVSDSNQTQIKTILKKGLQIKFKKTKNSSCKLCKQLRRLNNIRIKERNTWILYTNNNKFRFMSCII